MANILDRFTSLFGTRFGSFFRSFQIGNTTPIWVDVNNSAEIYNTVPEIRAAISVKASMFSSGVWKLRKPDGETIESDPIIDFLNNPNPLSSGKSLLTSFKIYEQSTGNGFLYKNKNSELSRIPSALWALPSDSMIVDPTGKIYDQVSIDEIIQKYTMRIGSLNKDFETDKILHTKIKDSIEELVAESPFTTLKKPISNIVGAYNTRNVLINNKGALGILSSESKDSDGAIPLSSKERERVTKEYLEKYGTGANQSSIIISSAALKWSPMSFPTKDLMLFEEIDADFAVILDFYGLDENIFTRTKGSTFENKNQGLKATYQNTIIPEAKSFSQQMTKFLNVQNGELYLDYSHLPVFQEDKNDLSDAS